MTEKPFEVGEIVYLKSGSPAFTITILVFDGVRVSWMEGRQNRSARFPAAALIRKRPRFDFGAGIVKRVASEESLADSLETNEVNVPEYDE
jgi:uncharacterized protein YodC (DUF2158 family)